MSTYYCTILVEVSFTKVTLAVARTSDADCHACHKENSTRSALIDRIVIDPGRLCGVGQLTAPELGASALGRGLLQETTKSC